MTKIKQFFKENITGIIILVLGLVIFNIKLPYYIEAPGGTIDISDRIKTEHNNNINGKINLLYVREYDGNVATFLLGKLIKSWDIFPIENLQINNETSSEIKDRDKIMLENSVTNAMVVAYLSAGKSISITDTKNMVVATTEEHDGSLKVDDEIIKINDIEVKNLDEIRSVITECEEDNIKVTVIRNKKEKELNVKLTIKDGAKIMGVAIITNYEYELDPEIELNFKNNEGGSSGGMMIALTIYASITDEDIIKGRNIAGTGTIDGDGNIGEIGGVKYKISGAVKNKVDIVFVCSANYDEAIKVKKENNYDIEIVKVDTFPEVIDYLRKES